MAMEKKQCLTHALKITEEAARGGYQKSLDVLLKTQKISLNLDNLYDQPLNGLIFYNAFQYR